LDGEAPLLGTLERYVQVALVTGISLLGALIGDLEGASFTGDFERQVEEGSGREQLALIGALRGEPGEGFLFWGL
jgi:hypothetical protein